jgi:hypothetical protein
VADLPVVGEMPTQGEVQAEVAVEVEDCLVTVPRPRAPQSEVVEAVLPMDQGRTEARAAVKAEIIPVAAVIHPDRQDN